MAYTRKHTRKAPVRRTRGGKNPVMFPRGARLGKGAISLNNAIARNAANAAARAAAAAPQGLFGPENSRSWGDQELNANEADPSRGANARARLAEIEAEGRARNAAAASPLRLMNGSVEPPSGNGWPTFGSVNENTARAKNARRAARIARATKVNNTQLPTIQMPNAVRNASGNPVDPLTPASSPNYNLNSSFVKVKAEHNFVKSWANSMKTKINGLLAPAAAAAGGSRRRSRKH